MNHNYNSVQCCHLEQVSTIHTWMCQCHMPHAGQRSDTTCFQFPVLNWLFAVYSQIKRLCRSCLLVTAQCAKKVLSVSPGLIDFQARLVDSVRHLPDVQVKFLRKI